LLKFREIWAHGVLFEGRAIRFVYPSRLKACDQWKFYRTRTLLGALA